MLHVMTYGPSGVEQCVDFLADNPDYSVARPYCDVRSGETQRAGW
jgi:hypothetical protein